MSAQPVVSDQEVVDAARSLAAEGRAVNGFSLRRAIGRGDPGRLGSVWETARQQADAPAVAEVAPVVVLPQSVAELAGQARQAVSDKVAELAGALWAAAERVASERVRAEVDVARVQIAECRRELEEARSAVVEADADAQVAREQAQDVERQITALRAETDAEVERVRGDLRMALDAIGRLPA